ncbi:MAG: DNA polymerase I [Oscillospiraceae bacterium]|nr:DNA polymerase I [Oscillospiraceae bacterium]
MRLLVIDGNSIMNRAFYGIKLLTTRDGRFTNALVGFLNIYDKLRGQVRPDRVAVAFDLPAKTFRHDMYDGYKAGRKGMPDELRSQLPILKELLGHMGLRVVECAGFEADDILGTLARAAAGQGGEAVIATGDRDALQLVGSAVSVLLAATKMGRPETTLYDEAMVEATYGLRPEQLLDLKALMGDASDSIPGVAGVGEKTAQALLTQFSTLDALYEQIDSADPPDTVQIRENLRQKLRDGRENAFLSRELGRIHCDAPVDLDMDTYVIGDGDPAALAGQLAGLEMFKLIERLGARAPAGATSPERYSQSNRDSRDQKSESRDADMPTGTVLLQDFPPAELYQKAVQSKAFDCLPDFDGNNWRGFWAVADGAVSWIANDPTIGDWLTLFADPAIQKRTDDAKALFSALLERDTLPAGFVMDTRLAAYLLNPLNTDYGLLRLAASYGMNVNLPQTADQTSLFDLAVPPDPSDIGRQRAEIFPEMARLLVRELEQTGQMKLLTEMELPLALVLADMERIGFAVDRAGIQAFGQQLGERIGQLTTEIYGMTGYAFNLNSPQQLAKALFEDLALPAGKKNKSGYSTDAEVLEKLRDKHPVIGLLLEYRGIAKLKSTYCDGLLKVIGQDGRIRTSFNQTETRTGRISSAEPNLQNIPVRQPLGRELRRFFIAAGPPDAVAGEPAAEGWLLADADYSQIELRVLAHMADEPAMKAAFNTGADIHRITAAQVFGVTPEQVTAEMRSRSKAVNFGIIYGIGPHSLSEDIGVGYYEAKRYIDEYLAHYAAVDGFMKRMMESAKTDGYAVTVYGRRRPLPELRASGTQTRAFGERVARNAPIQGTAADIIKSAMIRVWNRLRAEGLRARLILQVHDELIVETPAEETETVARLLKEEMEAAAQLSVKMAAEVHTGKTWYEAH